jgi:hypothetical protein
MEILLTTEAAASSYGAPVAVIDGQAYGPADVVPDMGMTAAELVRELAQSFIDADPRNYGMIGGLLLAGPVPAGDGRA